MCMTAAVSAFIIRGYKCGNGSDGVSGYEHEMFREKNPDS